MTAGVHPFLLTCGRNALATLGFPCNEQFVRLSFFMAMQEAGTVDLRTVLAGVRNVSVAEYCTFLPRNIYGIQ